MYWSIVGIGTYIYQAKIWLILWEISLVFSVNTYLYILKNGVKSSYSYFPLILSKPILIHYLNSFCSFLVSGDNTKMQNMFLGISPKAWFKDVGAPRENLYQGPYLVPQMFTLRLNSIAMTRIICIIPWIILHQLNLGMTRIMYRNVWIMPKSRLGCVIIRVRIL